MPDKKKEQHLNLKQQIYRDLKNKLVQCVYPPGTVLNELLLTEEYNVSRTPIREAVSQLEKEHYVRILPKKGIYIPEITIEDVLSVFQTRVEIEPITLKLAVPYLEMDKLLKYRRLFEQQESDLQEAFDLDLEMHLYLIDCCRNNYLINMMHRVFEDNTRLIVYTGQNKSRIHNARSEHLQILNSLISMQEPEQTSALLREHIINCRTNALHFFSSSELQRSAPQETEGS